MMKVQEAQKTYQTKYRVRINLKQKTTTMWRTLEIEE